MIGLNGNEVGGIGLNGNEVGVVGLNGNGPLSSDDTYQSGLTIPYRWSCSWPVNL